MHDLFSPLRTRLDRDGSELSRQPVGPRPGGPPVFVGQVVAHPLLPTATNVYYSVNPVSILGTEGEGNAPVLLVDTTTTVLVCVLGTQAPSLGDNLICRYEGNRWVAERYGSGGNPGSGGASIPGCACPIVPQTLRMSTSGPCDPATFQSCVLQYGPTPPEFSGLGLGTNSFLSTQSFTDTYTGTLFRYNLVCNTVFFQLSRVYLATSSGVAYHDSTIYTWVIGLGGNTCTPFFLSNGSIFSGGNPNCLVTISQ
jgi:hypothetical protein